MMYDVFICCTSTDVKIAERLSAYLKYYNIECFVAHRDIPADVPWAHGIAEAIRNSKIMVALFSEDFNTGTWMDDELKTANTHGVPIITFRLCDAPYGDTKAVFLKNTTYVEACENAEEKIPVLYEEVCNMLGFPIEQALPIDEVLIEKQPETNALSAPKENTPEKQDTDTKEETPIQKGPSRSLLPAIIIGVVLLVVVKLFLDWILN
jgi:hypothetical protein